MRWYFGFNQQASLWFADMVRGAVATAATHAPQLEPHCLYDGDDETDPTRWLRGRGVTIEPTVAPLRDRLMAPDDQGALNSAIPLGDWEPLPHTLNWRPVFGINLLASVVHWHGPKPRHVEKTLATGVTSAPDAAMRGLLDAAPESYRPYLQVFRAALDDAS